MNHPVMIDLDHNRKRLSYYTQLKEKNASDKKKAAGYAWGLMGLTAKLAQSVSGMYGALLF